MVGWRHLSIALALISSLTTLASAQQAAPPSDTDDRTQYPAFFTNSYFSIKVGYLDEPFSERQLEPGFQAAAVDVPHLAANVVLFGHQFGKYVAAQATYMRPVLWATYSNLNGSGIGYHVWTAFGALTLTSERRIVGRVSMYGEGGVSITSRRGFQIAETAVVRDAHFSSPLVGAGVTYRLKDTRDVIAGVTFLPAKPEVDQPRVLLFSGGLRYTMRRLSQERVEANRRTGFVFPANLVEVEYTTGVGYRLTNFVGKTVPIFWSGDVRVDRGIAIHYDRNVFHTRKVLAVDLGASAGIWRSRADKDRFFTISVYPLLRFMVLRTRPADLYVAYSLAGPTYTSRSVIDDRRTGSRATFQDFMGVGVVLGPRRTVSAGVKISHYSNGDLSPQNPGVTIPITFSLGYAF